MGFGLELQLQSHFAALSHVLAKRILLQHFMFFGQHCTSGKMKTNPGLGLRETNLVTQSH